MKTALIPILLAALFTSQSAAPAEPPGIDWPQWRGTERDGVWRETGLLSEFPTEFEAKWSEPISSGYCGPTVADGRVYVMDRVVEPEQIERVHCFCWQSGKEIWTYQYPCSYERIGYKAGPRCSVLVAGGRAYTLGADHH